MGESEVEVGPVETFHPETGEISTEPKEESSGEGKSYFCLNKDCPGRKMFD